MVEVIGLGTENRRSPIPGGQSQPDAPLVMVVRSWNLCCAILLDLRNHNRECLHRYMQSLANGVPGRNAPRTVLNHGSSPSAMADLLYSDCVPNTIVFEVAVLVNQNN